MSTLKVDSIGNGGSAVNFTTNIQVGDGLVKRDYYEQASEPSAAPNAAVWYDTADEQLKLKVNDKWYNVTASAPPSWYGSRGVFADDSLSNDMQYITIASAGNATNFGDLTVARSTPAGCSNGTRGLIGGGYHSTASNRLIIDYITFASTGNATDFGDLTAGGYSFGALSNGTRGVWGGGEGRGNVIDYVTIATTGNATDFGDLLESGSGQTGAADGTRGLFAGGIVSSAYKNTIQYITVATTGNATDFGDLLNTSSGVGACAGT